MGLTRRQAAIINHIIQEEVQGVLKGRAQRDGHLERGKLIEEGVIDPMSEDWQIDVSSVLKEEGPKASRVDTSVIKEQLVRELEQFTMELSSDMLSRWKRELFPAVARAINAHGLLDLDFPINGRRIESDLNEYGEHEMTNIEMELVNDLAEEMMKYADAIVEMLVGMSDQGE